jgi:hypothetical protein
VGWLVQVASQIERRNKMTKKHVHVHFVVEVDLDVDDGVDVEMAIDEMHYSFVSTTTGVRVKDTSISHEVKLIR